jgi:hypothetical protein
VIVADNLVRDGAVADPDYLTQKYGVTEAEALRRLQLQDATPALEERLPGQRRRHMDRPGQRRGPRRRRDPPEAVRNSLDDVADRDHVSVVRIDRSLRTLRTQADRITAAFAPGVGVDPVVDMQRNAVVVYGAAADQLDEPSVVDRIGIDPDLVVIDRNTDYKSGRTFHLNTA